MDDILRIRRCCGIQARRAERSSFAHRYLASLMFAAMNSFRDQQSNNMAAILDTTGYVGPHSSTLANNSFCDGLNTAAFYGIRRRQSEPAILARIDHNFTRTTAFSGANRWSDTTRSR